MRRLFHYRLSANAHRVVQRLLRTAKYILLSLLLSVLAQMLTSILRLIFRW